MYWKIHSLVLCALCICLFFTQSARAKIFGDGVAENGVEDDRIKLSKTEKHRYQRFFGTISCDGEVKGTALLLSAGQDKPTRAPLVLTARHVLPENWPETEVICEYLPTGLPWGKQALSATAIWGQPLTETRSVQLLQQYASDWAVIALKPWKNWQNNALLYDTYADTHACPTQQLSEKAINQVAFIGFDTSDSSFRLDNSCQTGIIPPESPFYGADGLVWDDCQSVPGSSGGIIFREHRDTLEIIAIRVGALFDASLYPSGSAQGDRFDVNANTNVARLIDTTIQDAIRVLSLRARLGIAEPTD